MEGFSKLPKMQCFKEGGHVKEKEMCGGGKAYKTGGKVKSDDIAQDKKLIKKAFKQHDEAEHDKEPTEIKLKRGGRAKKEKGSVRKMKDGGGVYGAKKTSGDLDSIKKVKETKPSKAAAPSEATKRPNLKGSDVEKEKSKPAGEKDPIKKVPPTGNKKAMAPSKAAEKPSMMGELDAIDDIDGYAPGGAIDSTPLMQSAEAARLRRQMKARAGLPPAFQQDFDAQRGAANAAAMQQPTPQMQAAPQAQMPQLAPQAPQPIPGMAHGGDVHHHHYYIGGGVNDMP